MRCGPFPLFRGPPTPLHRYFTMPPLVPAPAFETAPGCAPDLSLLQAFANVPDTRSAHGRRHSLPALLALCVIALLSGRQNLTQIHRFAKDHPEVLEALGNKRPKRWVPVTTTLSTTLGSVRLSDLQEALADWFFGLFASARAQERNAVAAVDGKTSRASGVHVLNVFVVDLQQAVWQAAVDEKANEITVLHQILSALFEKYPFLQILTGDAMFSGDPLCSEIIQHGRHYLFQVKGNQGHLREKLELVFARHLNREPDEQRLTGEKKGATP